MSTTKHTPGPWFVSHSPVARKKISGGFGRPFKSIKNQMGIGGNIIANAFGGKGSDIALSENAIVEAEANAKLIAAAPELLAVLKEIEQIIAKRYQGEKYITGIDAQIYDKVRSVLMSKGLHE